MSAEHYVPSTPVQPHACLSLPAGAPFSYGSKLPFTKSAAERRVRLQAVASMPGLPEYGGTNPARLLPSYKSHCAKAFSKFGKALW